MPRPCASQAPPARAAITHITTATRRAHRGLRPFGRMTADFTSTSCMQTPLSTPAPLTRALSDSRDDGFVREGSRSARAWAASAVLRAIFASSPLPLARRRTPFPMRSANNPPICTRFPGRAQVRTSAGPRFRDADPSPSHPAIPRPRCSLAQRPSGTAEMPPNAACMPPRRRCARPVSLWHREENRDGDGFDRTMSRNRDGGGFLLLLAVV